MTTEIRIEAPSAETPSCELIAFFQERLSLLAEAMDLDVTDFDRKARNDQVQILAADVDDDSISLTYELRFSAFYPCSGIDYSGQHQRALQGRRQGNSWVFLPYCPPASRSTVEEF